MKSRITAQELETGCREALAKIGVTAEKITGSVETSGDWFLEVEIRQRVFHFGTVSRDGYCFIERCVGKEEDYLAGMPQPIFASDDQLWRMSFDLIRSALADPLFRGPRPVIV